METEATMPRTTSSRGRLMATLFAAQVCGSTGHSIGMAVGSIMAAGVIGTHTWSGLPIATRALGTALATWPPARSARPWAAGRWRASLIARGARPALGLGLGPP